MKKYEKMGKNHVFFGFFLIGFHVFEVPLNSKSGCRRVYMKKKPTPQTNIYHSKMELWVRF